MEGLSAAILGAVSGAPAGKSSKVKGFVTLDVCRNPKSPKHKFSALFSHPHSFTLVFQQETDPVR
jgi:hypothetical protein